jgi:hypothetical protein
MPPALRHHGVALHVEMVSWPDSVEDGDYVIAINSRRCVVWTPQDWVANGSWGVAAVRPLAVINDLLAEAGAVPRVYTLSTAATTAKPGSSTRASSSPSLKAGEWSTRLGYSRMNVDGERCCAGPSNIRKPWRDLGLHQGLRP